MFDYAIIVIGYNRLNSIKRLMNSLDGCYYDTNIDLIISIDKGDHQELERYVNDFKWKFGKKIVKLHKKRLGLKEHVLTCGNYLNEFNYDAIAVFEDDIYVAKDFFRYMRNTVEFYHTDTRIAGISLYKHEWNINANRPFVPLKTKDDVYFMQYAQSWGQVWMKDQWNEFYQWFKKNEHHLIMDYQVPVNITEWSEKSWLKYHIMYCIYTNKYFVYPHISLTTNFSDIGSHVTSNSSRMQVEILYGDKKEYNLCELNSQSVRYDAFFEPQFISKYLGIKDTELTIDLYGTKSDRVMSKYLLTSKSMGYSIIRKFGCHFRPHEANIINDFTGEIFYLYDQTNAITKSPKDNLLTYRYAYDGRNTNYLNRYFIKYFFQVLVMKIKNKLNKLSG